MQTDLRSRKFPLMERIERINQREEKIKESKLDFKNSEENSLDFSKVTCNLFRETPIIKETKPKLFTRLQFNKRKNDRR